MSKQVIEERQLELILKSTRYMSAQSRFIVSLLLETGIRVGEACKLRVGDLYWMGEVKSVLLVPAAVAKMGQERSIPVSQVLEDEAKEWMKELLLVDPNAAKEMSRYLLTGKERPISTRSVQRWILEITYQACGRAFTPHDFRHTFATRLLRVSNTRIVQLALGHAHLSTTERYTHPGINEMKEAVDKM